MLLLLLKKSAQPSFFSLFYLEATTDSGIMETMKETHEINKALKGCK